MIDSLGLNDLSIWTAPINFAQHDNHSKYSILRFPLMLPFFRDFHRSIHKESSLAEARPEFFLTDHDHRYYDID